MLRVVIAVVLSLLPLAAKAQMNSALPAAPTRRSPPPATR
jgi:hypothetical protein